MQHFNVALIRPQAPSTKANITEFLLKTAHLSHRPLRSCGTPSCRAWARGKEEEEGAQRITRERGSITGARPCDDLHGWKVSVLAQTRLSFDLSTSTGKLMRTIMAGLAAATARGVVLGRQPGQRPSDKKAKKVLGLYKDGLSYRLIGRNLGLSKNTVMEIVKRAV